MKRIKLNLLISSLYLFFSMSAAADVIEIDGIYYNYRIGSGEASVTNSEEKYQGDITIPETIKVDSTSYRVVSISGFDGCTGLTSITIPESVNRIGGSAFRGCTGLTSITIPSSVQSIVDRAFEGCSNLTTVQSKAAIAPFLGSNAFAGISPQAVYICPENSNYRLWDIYFSNVDYEICGNGKWYVYPDGDAYVYAIDRSKGVDYYSGEKKIKNLYIGNVQSFSSSNWNSIDDIENVSFFGSCSSRLGGIFNDCKNLKSVALCNSIEEISYCFNSPNLKWACLGNFTKKIESSFTSEALECIYIPESVKYIDRCGGNNTKVVLPHRNISDFEYFDVWGPLVIFQETVGFEEMGFNIYSIYSWHNAFYDTSNKTVYLWDDGYGNSYGYDLEDVFDSTIERLVFVPIIDYSDEVAIESDAIKSFKNPTEFVLEDFFFHTFDGSYAIFNRHNELIAGSSITNIPEETIAIGNNAFEGVNFFTEIELTNNITRIGNSAFKNCKNLNSIDIPANVTSIANNAFEGCKDLKKITVHGNNTVYDSRNNCNAIIRTNSNELIIGAYGSTIPSSVKAIAPHAFSTNTNTDVIVPESVISFGDGAFNGTSRIYFESDTPSVIPGDIFGWSVIVVPNEAYDAYCDAKVWCEYKDRIVTREITEKDIETYSVEGMSGILNAIGLNDVEKVSKLKVKGNINSYDIIVLRDKMPFLNELDLSEANIISSSKPYFQTYCTENNTLGDYIFQDCDKLINVTLPNSIKILGIGAFEGCSNLNRVDASGIEELKIGDEAFSSTNLKEFISPQNITEIGSYGFSGCGLNELNLHNITGSIKDYAFRWSKINTIKIDSIGGDIGSCAFMQNNYLKKVKIGTQSGELQDQAFAYCPSLQTVEFGKGPKKIGSEEFIYSNYLERFVAGEGLLEIGDYAFVAYEIYSPGLGYVKEIVIDRKKLKNIILPQSVEKIGRHAFTKNSVLSDFQIPESVTSIGIEAFSGCSSIDSIKIPSGVTEISDYAFKECTSLKHISFTNGLKSIGKETFAYCAIDSMKLPPSLITIKERAFYNCKMQELHLPSSIEFIEAGAFEACWDLNSIYTYTVEPVSITERTFSNWTNITLHVPSTSFWNYYWDVGWSKFDHKKFQNFNKPYDYFYLNYDYYLNGSTGYIEGIPDVDMRAGSGLIVESCENGGDDQQNLSDVTIASDGNGNSASIIGDNNLHIENLNVKINVKKGRWYFFAFPWDVPMDKISMQNGCDYIFRYYDGEERAKNGNGGWKNVNDSHLKAANGYIFQSAEDDVLQLSIEDVKFSNANKYCELMVHASENLSDASWNLVGNPYVSYYDMAATGYSAPVTVWDGEKYVAIRPGDDDYQFTPYEAFFLQKPEGTESLEFNVEGQMTKTQAETLKTQQIKARRARKIDNQRLLVNLELSIDSVCDRTRVVFNNRQKETYETACDAAKFESDGVPQIYTIGNDGINYAINERPTGDGIVLIGYEAAQSGYFTLKTTRMDTDVILYDKETKETHDFKNGAYTFYSDKGKFEKRFSIGIPKKDVTKVEEVDLNETFEVIEGGLQFHKNVSATIYNIEGMLITTQNEAGKLKLQPGIYVVVANKKHKKVVVK